MKLGIVGCGPIALNASSLALMMKVGVEVVVIDPKEAHDRGVLMNNMVVDELKTMREVIPRMLELPFTPPMTRRERRKINRKKK